MRHLALLLALLLFLETGNTLQPTKILWDDSHILKPQEIAKTGFMCPIPYGEKFFEERGYVVDYNENKELTYAALKEYDVLVVWVPFKLFTAEEVASVDRFVRNGGGLIIFGEYATTLLGGIAGTSDKEGFDSLSKSFGVEFVNVFVYGEFLQLGKHPLTSSLQELVLTHYGVLESTNPYFIPVIRTRTDKVVVGVMRHGEGRIVFSTDAFFDERADSNALTLASNTFSWLSETGGPFRLAQKVMLEASSNLSGGIELFESGDYKESLSMLHESTRLYRKLNKIYDTDVSARLLAAEGFIQRCNIALEAEDLLAEGERLLSKKEFSEACEAFNQAAILYEKAGAADSSEARALAQKADDAQNELEKKRNEEERKNREQKDSSPVPTSAPPQKTENRYVFIGLTAVCIAFLFVVRRKFDRRGEKTGGAAPEAGQKEEGETEGESQTSEKPQDEEKDAGEKEEEGKIDDDKEGETQGEEKNIGEKDGTAE